MGSSQMTFNDLGPKAPLEERRKRATALVNPRGTCDTCLHLIKLRIYQDENTFFIAVGCKCKPHERVSDAYTDVSEARLDLASLSWRV